MLKWIKNRFSKPNEEPRQIPVVESAGEEIDPDSPLARAINAAFQSGEMVIWNEGDPLP